MQSSDARGVVKTTNSKIAPWRKTGQNALTVVRITVAHIVDAREVKETLKVAATEKLSYADALKQKRATKRVEKPVTVENPPVVEAVVTNERKSVETQSGTKQTVKNR